ncbi:hypothetical protein [Citrobacter braakii]|uniref:hypothetical protein n=1 Tax=Citrobacter braakii TaxID=57706 RepID=UPI002DB8DE58|nr:hypothetical protein [Citrobacter braakii]MEB7708080.1 hypothetical protein [Citrobacter braakii]
MGNESTDAIVHALSILLAGAIVLIPLAGVYLLIVSIRRWKFLRLVGNNIPRSNLYIRAWGGIAIDMHNERFAVYKKGYFFWFDASQMLDIKVTHTKHGVYAIPLVALDLTLRSEQMPSLLIEAFDFSKINNIVSLLKLLIDKKESTKKANTTGIVEHAQIADLINAVNSLTDAVTSLTNVARNLSTKSQGSADITK